MFLKNKHVIASLIIAPILAIISYFTVDYYVSEVPHKVKDGQFYKFLVKPNCRWESGSCDLLNGDLKLNITSSSQMYGLNYIYIQSSAVLKDISFAVVAIKGSKSKPFSMKPTDASYTLWQSNEINIVKSNYLQLAISINKSIFYTEIPAIFIHKEKL